MILCRFIPRLLLAAGAFFAGCLAAAGQAAHTTSSAGGAMLMAVRAWTPTPGADDVASAEVALQQVDPQTLSLDRPEFRAEPRQPVWYALDLAADPQVRSLVLELTHPSIRAADLYLPQVGGTPIILRSGRDVPMQAREKARFPATLQFPPGSQARTVYLRLKGTVPLRGQFLLQAKSDWERQSSWQLGAMTVCFSIAALAILYALWCAWRLRSKAYGLYALLALSIGVTGMFISGYGETWAWPMLSDWRAVISSAMACISAGLALLLAERAFAMEVRAPRFSRLLRMMGVLCPMAGVLGMAFDVTVHQMLSHGAAAAAIAMSLCSFWIAWRTDNRVAVWLLLGFVPVSLGVGVTTLAVAGIIPFTPWVLMAMPLGSAIEVPFNLYGLHLLERRRALVHRSRAELAQVTGPAGETRQAMLRRLSIPPGEPAAPESRGTLMLLRFPNLAPGSARLRALDSVDVEHFLHAMMESAVRPGNHIGRPSFHEIVLRNPQQASEGAVHSLLTALFAQALRCERFGIEPRDVALRIAYGRLDDASPGVDVALERLVKALDAPAQAGLRKLEITL
jgi:hypothetical protein